MICGCCFQKEDISNIFSFFKGGPLVTWIPKKDRFYLIGTVSGGFFECSNILPGIFVQVDEISVLNFLRKEIFGDEPIQLGTYSKFTLLGRVGTGKKAEKETLIPDLTIHPKTIIEYCIFMNSRLVVGGTTTQKYQKQMLKP